MIRFASAALGLTAVLALTVPVSAAPAESSTAILDDALVAVRAERDVVARLPIGSAPPENLRNELISTDLLGISVLDRADSALLGLSPEARFVLSSFPLLDQGRAPTVADYDRAIEMIEARLADPIGNRPLPRAAGADSTLSAPAPAAAQTIEFDDEVDLINQAIDALESGDLAAFDALGTAAARLDTLPPATAAAFAERDAETLINLGELLDETDLDYLTWADDAVGWEQRLLDEYLSDTGNTDVLAELLDADDDGASLLFLSRSRDIQYSAVTMRILGEIDLADPPSSADYARARNELRTMYENGITHADELTDAMLDPAGAAEGGIGTAGWLALGGISLAAIGLGVVALRRTRQADDHARLAMTDGLTGLHNRRKFDDDLEARSQRGDIPVAMLMIDVDHFKQFNDTHGHAVGDDVLRLVGAAVSATLRKHDLAYRYGGEEFCALLPNTTADEARHVAERVRQAISEIALPVRGKVTASIGVSTGASVDVVDVVEHADSALYDAKASGRNCVIVG